jgi:1,4-alpha-glucan branching enzyme
MSQVCGNLCLVLHGHLPYVLHHGAYPHGEEWLYEAAAETYLPLLEVIRELVQHNVRPALTIGLTPVLLEQLAHERFKSGFLRYVDERIERAESDRREFERGGAVEQIAQAERWIRWYGSRRDHFLGIDRDIPAEFARLWRDDQIEILTSAATHAYLPLLLNDQMIHAQLTLGGRTTAAHLGRGAAGLWLPECAYRPRSEQWMPAVLYDNPRSRPGLELFIANAGLTHFFVDSHSIVSAAPIGVMERGQFEPVAEATLHWDQRRGWRSPLDPVGVVSEPQPPECFAFARHPRVSEQVWSGIIGYPGSGEYLDFHRRHGEHGLRYHKVTHNRAPLGDKQVYRPEDTFIKLYEHSQHFCRIIRETLDDYHHATGRTGTVVASFDAELFGHWWFEGPGFLRDVIFTLSRDPKVKLATAVQVLESHPPDKVMRLPEGSWGEQGNHSVWLNEKTSWMWEMEYRAEGRFLKLLHALPWRSNDAVRGMLERGARELLLAQASDWPFVVHSQGAVDYGITRFSGHATRFERLLNVAESLAAGGAIDAVEQSEIAEADSHDVIFPEIDLNWWM